MGRSTTAMLETAERTQAIVRAAGGAILRRGPDGGLEVALVHRPHREDWTFPKGKVEPGETLEECARREVAEETGFTCRLGPFIGHTEYRHRSDRPKVVAYWTMTIERGAFAPGREVDELRWVTLEGARDLLTWDRDVELLGALDAAARELVVDGVLGA